LAAIEANAGRKISERPKEFVTVPDGSMTSRRQRLIWL
jgi:hypothetical protein